MAEDRLGSGELEPRGKETFSLDRLELLKTVGTGEALRVQGRQNCVF
jgi:hypothetical protein